MIIKRTACQNCGPYFVLKSKTYYCDRKQETGRSCKQIGNKKEYLRRIASDPALQEYERRFTSSIMPKWNVTSKKNAPLKKSAGRKKSF